MDALYELSGILMGVFNLGIALTLEWYFVNTFITINKEIRTPTIIVI